MKYFKNIRVLALSAMVLAFSCQKMDRPALGDYLQDSNPPGGPLKFYVAFDGTSGNGVKDAVDSIQANYPVSNTMTSVDGISGKAMKGGTENQYIKYSSANDFVSTVSSFTVSFWMKGVGQPVTGGTQGLFSISNSTQFWGNLEVFLENNNNGNEAFIKVHLLNANIPGGGEQWIADNAMKFANVLDQWTHVVFTYDETTSGFKTYINGTLKNDRVLNNGNYGKIKFNNFNGLVIGTFAFQASPSLTNHGPEEWAKSFNGTIDQFRLYNTALTPAEISALFTGKK